MNAARQPAFSYFEDVTHPRPDKAITMADLADMIRKPRVGAKDTAPALTPFVADGKKKEHAQSAMFTAIVLDHDHDDQTRDGILALYEPFGVALMAFTTSSHLQPGKGRRWKVVIPLKRPIPYDVWKPLAMGACLLFAGDPAQARGSQVFYAPNKLTSESEYGFIIKNDRPLLDATREDQPFIRACRDRYQQSQTDDTEARITVKPRMCAHNGDADVIDKILSAYDVEDLLAHAGYRKQGRKYLRPGSESGEAGVVILDRSGKRVAYSHHGTDDPLSALNHGGHALDALDVIATLRYGGDVGRAIASLAPHVDPDGQKQRQREYMRAKEQQTGYTGTGPTIRIEPGKTAERAQQILRSRAAPKQFDINHLPKQFRDYVSELCQTTDTDPIIITMAVLVSISALVNIRAYIPEGTYFSRLYGLLWILVQDSSGAFKTTGLNKGSRMIFQTVGKIREQVKAWEKEKLSYGMSLTKEQKEIVNELNNNIHLAQHQSPLMPNKASAEGLLEIMAMGQRGAILSGEYGEWLANMTKSHNAGLKALFTDFFDVPAEYSYKTRTGGYMIIQRPYVSIMGLSTRQWVQENINLGDVESGFFARHLIFTPPPKRVIPPALPRYTAPIDDTFEQIVRYNLTTLDNQPREFGLTPDAAGAFEAVHAGIYDGMQKQCTKEEQELLSPYAKRWSPYVLKLAMLFQIMEDPARDISLDAIIPAAALVEYAMASTIHLFRGDLGLSPFQRDCEAVLKFIAKKGGDIERQALLSSRILTGGAKEYDEVLTMLLQGGQVNVVVPATGGKKCERIIIV